MEIRILGVKYEVFDVIRCLTLVAFGLAIVIVGIYAIDQTIENNRYYNQCKPTEQVATIGGCDFESGWCGVLSTSGRKFDLHRPVVGQRFCVPFSQRERP